MDNEFKELEAELRRLRPRTPAPKLQSGIERELAGAASAAAACGSHASRGKSLRFWWVTIPLAAAAAWAVLSTTASRAPLPGDSLKKVANVSTPSMAAPEIFRPVAAKATPLENRAESLVTLADGTVARRTRETYLATITWKNPRTNASFTWSVPREEVRVVPVSYE